MSTKMDPTSKTVCLLGSKGSIVNSHNLNASQFLDACGKNTGNLLFQYACTKLFEGISHGNIGHDIPYRHDHVNGKHDFLILPCANFINPRFDMSGLVNYLKKITIPIVPIGLGAQHESTSDGCPELSSMPESIQELVGIFRLSSPKIFVRGEFSKDMLIKYGIDRDRISIIGCPSNFIGDEQFMRSGVERCLTINDKDVNLLITGDEVWPKNPGKREVERKLVSLLLERGGGYLVQSVEPLVKNMIDNKSCKISEDFCMILKQIGFQGMSYEPRSYLRLYDSVQSWMFGIRDISFSTGLRLHGNMCSLQSGIPSIWIYHDSRTEELCKAMSLPSVSLAEAHAQLDNGTFLSIARDLVHESWAAYLQKRSHLKSQFVSSLETLGIKININSTP